MRILETVITLILVSPFGLPFNYKLNRSLIRQSSIFGPLTKVNASLVCCWFSCVLLLLEILPTRIFFGDIPVGQQNASALLDTHSSACFFFFFFSFLRWHVSFAHERVRRCFLYEAHSLYFTTQFTQKSVNVSHDQNNLCSWPRAIRKTFFFSFPLRANAKSRVSQLNIQQSNLVLR